MYQYIHEKIAQSFTQSMQMLVRVLVVQLKNCRFSQSKKHSNVKINSSYTIPLPPHLLLQVLPPLHPLSLLCLRHCQMRCLGYCKYLHTANKIIKHQKIFNYEFFRLYFISIFLTNMYSFNLLSLNYHIHVDIRSMMSAGSWNNQDKLPSIEILSQLPQVFKMQSKTQIEISLFKKIKNYRRTQSIYCILFGLSALYNVMLPVKIQTTVMKIIMFILFVLE